MDKQEILKIVGDMVRINPDLETSSSKVGVAKDMLQYAGKTTRITRSWESIQNGNCYRIDLDHEQYIWQDWMFVTVPANEFYHDLLTRS